MSPYLQMPGGGSWGISLPVGGHPWLWWVGAGPWRGNVGFIFPLSWTWVLFDAMELPREIKVKAGALLSMHRERPQIFQPGWCRPGWDKGEAEGMGQLKGFWKSDVPPMICSLWSGKREASVLTLTPHSNYTAKVEKKRNEKVDYVVS